MLFKTAFSFLFVSHITVFAQTDSLLSVNGNNIFDMGKGTTLTDEKVSEPRDYLTNATDLRIGLNKFYLDARFRIDAPNQAFMGSDPVAYRAYFNRLAIGFKDEYLSLRIGTFETGFANGLSLQLREDLITDRAVMLDGILLEIPGKFYEIKACVGQPLMPKIKQGTIGSGKNKVTQFFENLQYRDLVTGVECGIDPLHFFPSFDLFNSFHASFGAVLYQNGVDSMRLVKKGKLTTVPDLSGGPDKTIITDTLDYYLQNQTKILLPSISLAIGTGLADFKFNHTLFYDQRPLKPYVSEQQDTFYLDTPEWKKSPNHSSYVMTGLNLGSCALSLEYKNYWYFRENSYSAISIKEYLDPPKALYSHTWQLLTKHVLPNFMYDIIGYNVTSTWDIFNTILTGSFNYGGSHNGNSFFAINSSKSSYYEIYCEAVKQIIDPLTLKAGIDYGRIEPDLMQNSYLTSGFKCDIGPFANSSFSLQGEFQLIQASIFAEENNSSFLRLIPQSNIPANLTDTSTLYYLYGDLPDNMKSISKQNGYNCACILTYNYGYAFSFNVTCEHLEKPDSLESEVVVSRIKPVKSNNYVSFGMSWRPFVNHELRFEAGEFSGGKRCNTGVCVSLPPFRGFKIKLTSAF